MITTKDLTGDLNGCPLEVARILIVRSLDYIDWYSSRPFTVMEALRILQRNSTAGFAWHSTVEGGAYWDKVVNRKYWDMVHRDYHGDISVFPIAPVFTFAHEGVE